MEDLEEVQSNGFSRSWGGAARTHARPYISEKGAINRGPIANERRKILKVNAITVGFVMPNFMATSGKPGAMIELANGATNVYSETWHETWKSITWLYLCELTDDCNRYPFSCRRPISGVHWVVFPVVLFVLKFILDLVGLNGRPTVAAGELGWMMIICIVLNWYVGKRGRNRDYYWRRARHWSMSQVGKTTGVVTTHIKSRRPLNRRLWWKVNPGDPCHGCLGPPWSCWLTTPAIDPLVVFTLCNRHDGENLARVSCCWHYEYCLGLAVLQSPFWLLVHPQLTGS